VVKLKAFEFRFRGEPDDYVSEPDFIPLVWVKKDDADDEGDGNDAGMMMLWTHQRLAQDPQPQLRLRGRWAELGLLPPVAPILLRL
jgi:hypothetical protein